MKHQPDDVPPVGADRHADPKLVDALHDSVGDVENGWATKRA